MTDDELRSLVGSSAADTAKNAEAIDRLARFDRLARRVGDIRKNMTYNTQTFADSMALAAAAMELGEVAMELSANTSRNLDKLRQDIAELKKRVGIVVDDSRTD
jgi:hypothetical protein